MALNATSANAITVIRKRRRLALARECQVVRRKTFSAVRGCTLDAEIGIGAVFCRGERVRGHLPFGAKRKTSSNS